MKKYLYILLAIWLGIAMKALPQSMTISGGSDHGVVICAEGYLYAWGNNKNGQLGLEAPYNTQPLIWQPRKVDNPNGLTFSQVTAGSGSHNVALSCNNVVYAWGANSAMQCGQNASAAVTTPTPVPCGEAPGYNLDGTPGGPYLGGVKYVAASTAASFALLETGEVVAWGGNGNGGNWIATPTRTPKYIRRTNANTGPILQNVVHVAGGDNNAMFLVDANGDGLGELYSIGNWNGRGGDGGANAYTAEPVINGETNQPLVNIRMAAIMDVGGFAVDGVTGYVYGWGNGGWGCSNGLPNNQTTTNAQRIPSGQYAAISGEEYLTDVIEVIGGNGYGAAITKEGYLLYWGNNTPAAGSGGVLPNGNTGNSTCDTGPQFAVYCNGAGIGTAVNGTNPTANPLLVDDAVRISRGDLFAFMINKENKYYVWGSNSEPGTSPSYVGTLGLGNTSITYKNCLTELTIPCEKQDQCPEAYMVGPLYKCPGESVTLFSGFTTPTALGNDGYPLSDRYYFRWYKDGVLLNTTTKNDSRLIRRADIYNNTGININHPGVYKVEIEYIDNNVPCNACSISDAEIEVIDLKMPVDTLITQSCVADPLNPTSSDQVCFEFNSKYSVGYPTGANPVASKFLVYASKTGGTSLSTVTCTVSNPNGTFCVSGNHVTVNNNSPLDTTYTIWLEDVTTQQLSLYEGKAATNSGSPQSYGLLIECWSDVILSDLTVWLRSYYGPASTTARIVVYNATKNTNGQYVPGTIYTQSAINTLNFQDTQTACVINGNITLEGNSARGARYFIGVTFTTTNFNCFMFPVTHLSNSPLFTTPVGDNLTGKTVIAIGATQNSYTTSANPADYVMFTDVHFEKLTDYDCGRMQLTSKYWCPPCNRPNEVTGKAVSINPSQAPVNDTIRLCKESPNLTLAIKPLSVPSGAKFDVLWYENNLNSTEKQTNLNVINSTYSTAIKWSDIPEGSSKIYYVKVRDNEKPAAAACWVYDSVIVKANPVPTATLTDPNAFCSGGLATEPAKTLTGYNITWYTGADGLTATTPPSVKDQAAAGSPHTFFYKVENNTTGCISAVNTYTVKVDTTTPPTVNNDIIYLISDTLSNGKFKDLLGQKSNAAIPGTGFELVWYDKNKNLLGTTPPTPSVPSVDEELTYYVSRRPTTGSLICESELVEVKVKIYLAPAPATTALKYCKDAGSYNSGLKTDYDVDFQNNVTINTTQGPASDYHILWYTSTNPTETGAALPSVPSTLTNNPGLITYYVTQKHNTTSAESSRVPLKIEVYGVKTPTVTGNTLEYCINDGADALQVQKVEDNPAYYYADGFKWYRNGTYQATKPTVNTSAVGTFKFGVTQTYQIAPGNVCEGDTAFIEVTVNKTEKPTVENVNYLKSEGTPPNSFPDLVTKNPNVAVTTPGCTTCRLVWMNADKSLYNGTGLTVPTPTIDPSVPEGQDQKLTYWVAQYNDATGCMSDTLEITVIISDSPMPKVRPLVYCETETPTDITNFTFSDGGKLAVVNMDGMPSTNTYKLVWYKVDPKANPGTLPLAEPINLIMTVPANQSRIDTVYYVTQQRTDVVDPSTGVGAESSASLVKITAYAKPAFTITNPSATCELPVNITNSWTIINGYAPSNVADDYYQDLAGTIAVPDPAGVRINGESYVKLTYTMPSNEIYGLSTCASDLKPVEVRIDTLSKPIISGPTSTCPGTQVTLNASANTNNPSGINYTWSGDLSGNTAPGDQSVFTSDPVSTTVGQIYKFKVIASSGACTGGASKESDYYEVEIGDGQVKGTMIISEPGVSTNPSKTFTDDVERVFYTCGSPFEIVTNYDATDPDFIWTNSAGVQIWTGATLPVTVTSSLTEGKEVYTLSYVNECPTKVEITVYAIPLTVNPDVPRMQLCENEEFKTTLDIRFNDPDGLNPVIEWFHDGSVISGATGATLLIDEAQPGNSGEYSYRVSNRGCVAEGDITGLDVAGNPGVTRLDVSAIVTVGLLPLQTICEKDNAQIGFEWINPASSVIEWQDPDGTISPVDLDKLVVNATPLFRPNGTHHSTYSYRVSVTNVYCRLDTVVKVNVDQILAGSILADKELCEGQGTTLDASSYDATDYIWTSTAYQGSKFGPVQKELPAVTSEYYLEVRRGVCSATDEFSVIVNPKPRIARIDSIGIRDRNIIAAPGYGTPPLLYGVDDQIPTNDSRKYDLRFGAHNFYIVDILGCVSDLRKYDLEAPKIYPPPYFTPNGDGFNDIWDVPGLNEIYPEAVVTIYDRFGKKLIEYKGAEAGWNGLYLGNNMPATDYWYEINIEEVKQQYVGHFTLIRR
jgi:gliding motility-associated-like protein